MTGITIDALFSPKGRIDRRAWWIGIVATAAAGAIGVALMNADTFDESANAISEAPTMAAFLWAALAMYVATVLTLKRLEDGAAPKLLGMMFGLSAATLLAGWGIGAFSQPFTLSTTALVLWALVLATTTPLIEAARRPSSASPSPSL